MSVSKGVFINQNEVKDSSKDDSGMWQEVKVYHPPRAYGKNFDHYVSKPKFSAVKII